MEFTYQDYVNMLDCLKRQGYIFTDYENYHKYPRCVILRHDVDYSLKKALELAEIEKQEGVSSTYMILVSSGFYNPMDCETQSALRELLNMGHRLGLHFDEANYEVTDMNVLMEHINAEMQILRKSVAKADISVVSMHRPSKEFLEADLDFAQDGMINSYGKTFFKDFKYVSDSRMCWREPIMDYINAIQYNRIHILTHAFWYSREREDKKKKIKNFLEQAQEERYRLLDQNFRNLQEYISYDGRNTST